MSDKLPDRRVRKTQMALADALISLLQKTAWDDITIQMICDVADVARSSFYAHYDNKGALLDQAFAARMADVRELIADNRKAGELATISWLVDHIAGSQEFYFKVLASTSSQPVFSRFKRTVHQLLADELAKAGHQVTNTKLIFVLGGAFALIQNWAETDSTQSVPALKAEIYHLIWGVLAHPT